MLANSRLSAPESALRDEMESVVECGLETFLKVGNALVVIRDNRLYRESHGTFEDYCRGRWSMSKANANRIIQSAEVASGLTHAGVTPTSERQVRPLVGLPKEDRQAAWDLAVESAPGGKVTEKHVEAVVGGVAPRPARPKSSPVPSRDRPPPRFDAEALAAAIEDQWSSPAVEVPEEPADIRAQRRAGIIPDGVAVVVDDPDPAEDDEPENVQGELSDAEFLATCPARALLNDPCRKVFDRDALFFRAVEEPRKAFHDKLRALINANKRRTPTGNYHYFLMSFLTRKHPRHWVSCDYCKGSGQEALVGYCHNCHGSGYIA